MTGTSPMIRTGGNIRLSVVVVRSFGLRPSPYLCRGAGRTFADIHVDGDFGGVVQVGHCVRGWEADTGSMARGAVSAT